MLNYEFIKKVRKTQGLTQKELAELINIKEPCYRNFENGYVSLSTIPMTKLFYTLNLQGARIDDLFILS